MRWTRYWWGRLGWSGGTYNFCLHQAILSLPTVQYIHLRYIDWIVKDCPLHNLNSPGLDINTHWLLKTRQILSCTYIPLLIFSDDVLELIRKDRQPAISRHVNSHLPFRNFMGNEWIIQLWRETRLTFQINSNCLMMLERLGSIVNFC
jgi:hypothetical protein